MSKPESLLKSVAEERGKYGTPLKNHEMGELLNNVAWQHRADGWGLASKVAGAHTIQPGTGTLVSRDLLVHGPSATMYDVLSDVAGEARPAWQGPMPQDMLFVEPVGTSPPPVEPRSFSREEVEKLRQFARLLK